MIEIALEKGVPVEALVTARDKAEYESHQSRDIQIFGPARMTQYDHLRRGTSLAIALFC